MAQPEPTGGEPGARPARSLRLRRRLRWPDWLPAAAPELSEVGMHEVLDLAVHHCDDVPGLVAGAEVFDQLVGLEEVVADLAAKLDGAHIPPQFRHLGLGFL